MCSEKLRQKYFSTCCEKLAQQQSISTIYYQVRRKFIFISIFKLTQKLNEYYALLMGNLICFFFFNFSYLKNKFIFNWKIITSQCCVGLCCTSAEVYKCPRPLEPPSNPGLPLPGCYRVPVGVP